MANVIAVCRSDNKGIKKEDIGRAFIEEGYGLENDAHADCNSHRQVSLLAIESIDKMRESGINVGPGDFAENFTTEGIDLLSLPVGARIIIGDEVLLEITQIGKKCHTGCAIFQEVGKCIMPKEGIFAKVIKGGYVASGDSINRIDENSDR